MGNKLVLTADLSDNRVVPRDQISSTGKSETLGIYLPSACHWEENAIFQTDAIKTFCNRKLSCRTNSPNIGAAARYGNLLEKEATTLREAKAQ